MRKEAYRVCCVKEGVGCPERCRIVRAFQKSATWSTSYASGNLAAVVGGNTACVGFTGATGGGSIGNNFVVLSGLNTYTGGTTITGGGITLGAKGGPG